MRRVVTKRDGLRDPDPDRDERWLVHDTDPPPDVGLLRAEIAEDPTGIFWR
jgi:hypothetical protein